MINNVIALRYFPAQLIRKICLKTRETGESDLISNSTSQHFEFVKFKTSAIQSPKNALETGMHVDILPCLKVFVFYMLYYDILLGCQSCILCLLTTVTFFSIQSVAFLGNSRGAPMTCNLYATPLQLVAFELLKLVLSFIIFG